ncbi:hypothetical protein RF679_06000 [Undibacterium cyanobacteriorum]|uniref:Uncharacterized protein n=1 Tax=Undibacterium cyanobacteriorum TaxID=3073561 RepID=A0ABY9RKV3_9BURK|nr:hypothetical protein [Undibacterium sp. 20NA77.5]WMW81833.1 hypothetical protein RF679_06000 [Undibacterium sp. 20NA77.5]
MVFLVNSKDGLSDILRLTKGEHAIMWIAHGLLTDTEIASLRIEGNDVTVLSNSESTSCQKLECTIATIAEHHPGHSVWVERVASDYL